MGGARDAWLRARELRGRLRGPEQPAPLPTPGGTTPPSSPQAPAAAAQPGTVEHSHLARLLGEHRSTYADVLGEVQACASHLAAIPMNGAPDAASWSQVPGAELDAAALYGLIRSRAPKRYAEIGDGPWTGFAHQARSDGDLQTSFTSLDHTGAAGSGMDVLGDLRAGDILFAGTAEGGSAAQTEDIFFNVLPALVPGVLVGVRGVYLPEWRTTGTGSPALSPHQAMAIWLLAAPKSISVLLPVHYVVRDADLRPHVSALWEATGLSHVSPRGSTFWFEKTREASVSVRPSDRWRLD